MKYYNYKPFLTHTHIYIYILCFLIVTSNNICKLNFLIMSTSLEYNIVWKIAKPWQKTNISRITEGRLEWGAEKDKRKKNERNRRALAVHRRSADRRWGS